MRKLVLIFAILLQLPYCEQLIGQEGLWQTWIARRKASSVVEGGGTLFVLADGALHSISKADGAVKLYDRSNGLSDIAITHISWSQVSQKLLVAYQSGTIDLISRSHTETISALKNATHIPSKTIHQICIEGSKAWLASEHGIIQLDLNKAIVEGTFLAGTPVQSVLKLHDDTLLAIQNGQLYKGHIKSNLQDPSEWLQLGQLGTDWQMLARNNNVTLALRNKEVYRILADNSSERLNTSEPIERIYALDDAIALQGQQKLYALYEGDLFPLADISATAGSGSIGKHLLWLARGAMGVYQLKYQNDQWNESALDSDISSPIDNNMYAMRYHRGHLYTVNGGRDKNRFFTKGAIQIFDGKRWTIINHDSIKRANNIDFLDPVDIIPHKDNEASHFFVATWGEGLYEFNKGKLVNRYDTHNSALASALPEQTNYTRVGSLCYDYQGNLWMAQGLTQDSNGGSVVKLTPDGRWISFDYPAIKASNSFHTHIAFPNGTKWLLDNHLTDHGEGVFVYNDRGTDDMSDDLYAHYSSLRDSHNREITFSKISAMAVDKKGALWLGANIGFFYVQRPDLLPTPGKQPVATRPIGTNTDGHLYYILDNISVSAIAVDRLNRKWIGTLYNGLYLVSEDGQTVLRHYTKENSPLLENRILSLATDDIHGNLYIGTSMGLSILNTHTTLNDTSETEKQLIAYPNPLRPEEPNLITIEGVLAGATIHISDSSGRLVHKGTSVDHRYEWNTYGTDGLRLPSGVYTIIVQTKEHKLLGKIKVSII